MKKLHAFKYLSVLTLPLSVWIAFHQRGLLTFLPLAYIFGFIPLLELLFKPNETNLNATEEELFKKDAIFDWLLYLIVPLQFSFLFLFLTKINEPGLLWWETLGRITGMGIMCGNFGINVAHELGHRSKWQEQLMAKLLLLTSLYMHFFIEHNRGHHKKVATEADPASANYGQTVYGFWLQSTVFCYLSAWKLEAQRLRKEGKLIASFHNEMLIFQLIQLLFITAIYFFFGLKPMLFFLCSATFGFLLLETVNYIEHYGLLRKKKEDGRYERVLPAHSWNSNHLIGRLLMFELSRHSDHHFIATRKYQILRHHDNSPQMPTGYPGMMVLSLMPPAWFWVMNRKIREMEFRNKS